MTYVGQKPSAGEVILGLVLLAGGIFAIVAGAAVIIDGLAMGVYGLIFVVLGLALVAGGIAIIGFLAYLFFAKPGQSYDSRDWPE